VVLARRLAQLGFKLTATLGTAARLHEVGLDAEAVFKVNEGRPNIVDSIKQGEISLIINTPLGRSSRFDEQAIRRAALTYIVPCVTTMTGAEALVEAIAACGKNITSVYPLQELHMLNLTT
ncbi:MAG: carbamoyl-phosphate synthase large subunit, partial [Pyrinomonadaceae bacterium]